jgi:hypothetical protein
VLACCPVVVPVLVLVLVVLVPVVPDGPGGPGRPAGPDGRTCRSSAQLPATGPTDQVLVQVVRSAGSERVLVLPVELATVASTDCTVVLVLVLLC